MDSDKELVAVGFFDTVIQAHSYRIVLSELMIPATVNGDTGGFGLGATVFVRKIDAEQAREALRNLQGEKVPTVPAWKCQCGEQVDAGFAVCWSCEKSFDSVEQMEKLLAGGADKETQYKSETSESEATDESPKEGFLCIDPEAETPSRVYSTMIRAITPRPIAWVSTISDDGIHNLAPFSYFNGAGSQPAALMFALVNKPDGTPKDTLRNIKANKQFVVNVVPYELREAMFTTSQELDYGESEFAEAGVTPMTSVRVRPPRVAESPVQFECELMQVVPVGEETLSSHVVIGKILLMHIAPEVLNGDGKIDPELVDTIGRMGGRDYVRTSERFSLPSKDEPM